MLANEEALSKFKEKYNLSPVENSDLEDKEFYCKLFPWYTRVRNVFLAVGVVPPPPPIEEGLIKEEEVEEYIVQVRTSRNGTHYNWFDLWHQSKDGMLFTDLSVLADEWLVEALKEKSQINEYRIIKVTTKVKREIIASKSVGR